MRHSVFDFSGQERAFFSEDSDDGKKSIKKNLKKYPDLRTWLPELAEKFEAMEDFSHDNIFATVKECSEEKETKVGVILNGARVLLTGQAVGISMVSAIEQFSKDKPIMRLKNQVD